MKSLLASLSLIIAVQAYSQDTTFVKSTFKGDLGAYLSKKLTFSPMVAAQGITGFGEVDFRINRSGYIDSIIVITSPHKALLDNMIQTLISTKSMWTPTKVNGEKVAYIYKFVVEYRRTKSAGKDLVDLSVPQHAKALKQFKKGKFEEGLELINIAISINPYKPEYYKLRSDIFKSLGDPTKSEMDQLKSDRLKNQLLEIMTLVAYGYDTR